MDFMGQNFDIKELPVYEGRAGAPLHMDATPLKDPEQVINAIKTVVDPDVGVDVYNLGLIYNIDLAENGNVDIDMTLTSPTCPYGAEMIQGVADSIADLDGVAEVYVKIVWTPSWGIDKISEEAKFDLDLF